MLGLWSRLRRRSHVRPSWARSSRCKSGRKEIIPIEAKRNCGRATDRGEEARSESAGRWTRTRYEALPSGASEQAIAKPRWSRLRRRKSGGRARKGRVLTWGDLASGLKGPRHQAEREVSRGRSSDEAIIAKGRPKRRAKRRCVSQANGRRCRGNSSYRLEVGAKPRGPRGAWKRRRRRTETSAQERAT